MLTRQWGRKVRERCAGLKARRHSGMGDKTVARANNKL